MIDLILSLNFEKAFTPLALFLCLFGASLADKHSIGLMFFTNLMFFEIIYFFNLHMDPKYYLLALSVDLLLVRLFLYACAPRFLILLLSLSVLYNGLSYLNIEIFRLSFIHNYYIPVMKTVIILSVLSIFTNGCLDAINRKRNNDSDRAADDFDSFYPCSFRTSKGIH